MTSSSRIAAAIVVPLWAGRLAGPPPDRVPDLPALLVFAASTAALGLVVLTVYDTALLYNLGHLGARLPVTAAALAVLAAARVAAPLLPRRPPGPGVESITRSFGAFLALFFVPALPVRYGLLGWGTTYVAVAAALVLVTAAAVRGIAGTFARSPVSRVRWLAQMAITVAAGLAAGPAASMLLRGGYPESRLLWAAAAFFICATTTCALIDPHTDGCLRRAARAARTVWAVGIRLSAWPLVVMSAVMLVGLFVVRSLGGAASTLAGEGPEGGDV